MKKFFKKMSYREQLLFFAFSWVILLIWLSYGFDWTSANMRSWKNSSKLSKEQEQTLNQKPIIDASLEEVLQRFNREKTFNNSRLVGTVDEYARNTGVTFNLVAPKTSTSEIIQIHSMRISIKQASIEKLLEFEEKIRSEYPYIGLSSLKISANKGDPARLNADFHIKSFELKESVQ